MPRKHPQPHAPLRAFTLIELLTVIAIVGILAAILIPVIGRIKQSARTTNCARNLSSLATAFQLYAADNKGLYPAMRFQSKNKGVAGTNPTEDNWQVELSAYQSRAVTDISQFGTGSDSYVFCPEFVAQYGDDPKWKSTLSNTKSAGYGMNPNLGSGINPYDIRFKAALIAQPARIILVGDSCAKQLPVGTTAWSLDSTQFGGYVNADPVRHAGKANYMYADGHVALLNPDDALVALKGP